jgi:broad specificity phosphatase PhoE
MMSEERPSAAIYVVRAGRTALSEEGRLQGGRDLPLTERGLEDAARVADRLAGANVTAVHTSPLLRARQTADAIRRALGASVSDPRSHRDLIDIDVGAWGGMTTADIAVREPRVFDWYFRMPLAYAFTGGERMIDAQRRVLDTLASIADATRGTAVVVTHELPIRSVLLHLRRLEGTAFWDPHVEPGSVTELRATADGLEIPSVLEDLLRNSERRRARA